MGREIQELLNDVFRFPAAGISRPLQVRPSKISLGGDGTTVIGVDSDGNPILEDEPEVPQGSYQWLFFETLDGAVPAGPTTFTIRGEPIPFRGAITEIDVMSSDPGADWQMRISLEGQGSIFRSSQAPVTLAGGGFFRPTPPGFWPETEGVVYPIPVSGAVPILEFFRATSVAPLLTVRVLIVAHPAE